MKLFGFSMIGSIDDSVSALFLTHVELIVRILDVLIESRILVVLDQTIGKCHFDLLISGHYNGLTKLTLDIVKNTHSIITVKIGESYEEFLAAPTGHESLVSDSSHKNFGHGFKHKIAYVMTVSIINSLEMIYITYTYTAYRIIRLLNKFSQVIHGASSVIKTRKRIRIGLLFKLLIVLNKLTLHGLTLIGEYVCRYTGT